MSDRVVKQEIIRGFLRSIQANLGKQYRIQRILDSNPVMTEVVMEESAGNRLSYPALLIPGLDISPIFEVAEGGSHFMCMENAPRFNALVRGIASAGAI